MTRLLILVEGQSEEAFVKQTLAPYLAERGISVQHPIILWTKRKPSGGGHRGGTTSWAKIRQSLLPLMNDSDAWVTTLMDFYHLPDDFPGYAEARADGDARNLVCGLQERFKAEFGHERFIPFLALHEFEAWLFCSPEKVAEHFGDPRLSRKVSMAVDDAGGAELINHGRDTHPKARMKEFVPGYKETSDGPVLMEKIGVAAIREQCPHFSRWIGQLEALGSAG